MEAETLDTATIPGSSSPAPSAPVETAPTAVPATEAAATKPTTTDYREARRAERAGKPLAEVPVVPAVATPAATTTPTPRGPKPADLAADERLRTRVAEAVRPLQEEITRLRQQVPAPAATAATPPAPAELPWKRYAAMPGAPKLSDTNADGSPAYASLEEHAAAMSWFVNEQIRQDSQRTEAHQQQHAYIEQRVTDFDARVAALKATDPDIEAAILPVAQDLAQRSGPYVVVRETLMDSPVGPQLLRHFQQHPEALQQLVTLPEQFKGLPQQAAVKAHISWMVREVGKLEAQISAAPMPAAATTPAAPTFTRLAPAPTTLGRKPNEAVDSETAAIKSPGTTAYRQLRRQQRAAAMTGR